MLGLSSAPTIFLPFVTKSQDLGTGIKIIQDIPYGDNANGEANLLDLYLPDQSVGKVPVVIWIHGGGLTTGNKSLASQGEALVKEGYALAAINYRLTPDYYLPTQIYDAKAAVRWVRANAEQYNLDPDHIGVLGGSAGAMIAASLGTSGGVAELEGSVGNNPNYSSRVQAAVALAGVYDLFNFYKDKVSSCQIGKTEDYDRCFLEWFLGCSLVDESCWNDLKLGSAISYVSADDPPFFLCIGQDDPTPKGSEDHTNFNQALLDAGVDSTLIMPPNTPHGQCFNNAYDQILDFLNTNLKQ
jgi:acetyl esterase/lipase